MCVYTYTYVHMHENKNINQRKKGIKLRLEKCGKVLKEGSLVKLEGRKGEVM